ncbi:MAG: LLM class F420-dependent oxidoreductase [Chloroflexi bacterium]|nr:LLM class F420-dependent oxidoreductase [Chloroflexota bacterium]
MRFGFFPGAAQVAYAELRATWRWADDLGYDTAWVPDHFYAGFGDPAGPCLEAWSVLAAMAEATRRIRIGPMVLGNTYRHPAVVANMAATLDVISGGRLTLGLGAGWMQVEHDGYGIPLPPARERLDRLDEAAQVIKLLLTEQRATFAGRYYQLHDALCEPKPVQRPHPPLLIGGGGEQRTLRIVAKHADEWNGEVGPSGMARKLGILHEHCAAVGRDPGEIAVSVLLRSEAEAEATYASMVQAGNLNLAADRQRLIEQGVPATRLDDELRRVTFEQFLPVDEGKAIDRLCEYAAVGVDHFITIVRPPYDYRKMERFLSRVAAHVQ